MNEEQWLCCEEPRRMLAYLRTEGKASDRKCRLLMCALARSLWADLPDGRSRSAVESAEAFADGCLGLDGLREAFIAARRATGGKYRKHVKQAAARANARAVAAWAAADDPLGFLGMTTDCGGDELGFYDEGATVDSLLRRQRPLVHDLFGNPFSPVVMDAAWLAFGDGAVVKLARSIYDSRRYGDMPVLADALEEAGCGDENLLGHLRDPGPHPRGCFALDAILSLARPRDP